MSIRLPSDSQRLTIYGMTGSGKTVAAMWHLSQRSFTSRPWIIYDFKGDDTIAQIPHAEEIGTNAKDIPKHPGIYVVRPLPEVDDENVNNQMWKIWDRGRIGVYVDEGYMVARTNKAFKALLTQGRSKQIPLITLSQRPVWMSRFVITEAEFHQIFFLSNKDDRKTVQDFIPYDITSVRLPEYHSYYYDVAKDRFTGLKPVPHPDEILTVIEDRLKKVHKLI